MDTSQRIAVARSIHGNRYNYSRWPKKMTGREIVTSICAIHGEWRHSFDNHCHKNNPTGCPSCAGTKPLTRQQRIEQAVSAHGDKFDYSLWPDKVSAGTRVITRCTHCNHSWEHNIDNHVRGRGCPNCAKHNSLVRKSHTTALWLNERFDRIANAIKLAKEHHGSKYSYAHIDPFSTMKDKVTIECQAHGHFETTLYNHSMKKSECPKCVNEKMRAIHGKDWTWWKGRLTAAHPNLRFTKPKGVLNAKSRIVAECACHGEWETTIDTLTQGSGCPACKGHSQKFLYINRIEGGAIKYGIAKDADSRLKQQNSKNRLKMERLALFHFEHYATCRSCESEIKNVFSPALDRHDMVDGWSETCLSSNIEAVINIIQRHGGVSHEV